MAREGEQVAGGIDVAAALLAGLASGAGDAVFGGLNDLVLVVGPDRRIAYANAIAEHVLGWAPERLAGRRITELLHPDDLGRGLQAESRVGTGAAARAVAGTYRLRHADGSWRALELNAGRLGPEGGRHTVITGRLDHDHLIGDRILALLTDGAPVDQVVELVPSFGAWRFPRLPFAVGFDGPHLARQVVGGPQACDLLRALVRLAPWDRTGRAPDALIHGTAAELDDAGRALAAEVGVTDFVIAPVASPDGATGAIATAWTHPAGPAVPSVEACVRTMGRSVALILQWHLQWVALERAAACDPLTGVANRRSLFLSLRAALDRADDEPVALLYLDLDRFKAVNDEHGHAVGDAVLAEVVRRVQDVLRPGAVLGRVGGDELVVVYGGLDARGAAEEMARAALAAVARPVAVGTLDVTVGVSVGVAVTDRPGGGPPDADDLLARADGALYVAKGAGGGRVVVTTGRGGLDAREVRRRPSLFSR